LSSAAPRCTGPVGAGNHVTLCDLRVFVDQAAEPVTAQNAHTGHFRRLMRTPGGWVLPQRPVRPVRVVVVGVLAEDQPRVAFTGYQHPVQALAAHAGDPSFSDRVRAGRTDRASDNSHADQPRTASG